MKNSDHPLRIINTGAALLCLCIPAAAQDRAAGYPVKTIRIITGSAPGGPLDFSMRLAAQKLSEAFGQPVVIEMLKSMAGVNFLHIPYKGAAPAMVDLIGGQTDLMYDSVLTSVPHIKNCRIRALAVGSSKRSPLLPDVPTVAESGLPSLRDFEADTWFGLVAPAATPREIVARLHGTLVKTIRDKDVTQRLLSQGMEPVLVTPEQFAERIRLDLPRWGKLVRTAGIKAE